VSGPEVGSAFDPDLALAAEGVLAIFNRAGLLAASDVHVATRLAALGEVHDERVVLGAAFAARAPRLGHVCVDLATIHDTASRESDGGRETEDGRSTAEGDDDDLLPWPSAPSWVEAVAGCPLVGPDLPLCVSGSNLYLNRLWLDEVAVAADLQARAGATPPEVNGARLSADLVALFGPPEDDPDPDGLQPIAAAVAVARRLAVIAGGPGTGKTTTVARLLALLEGQAEARGAAPPLVALAAPTGKAAARLEESVHAEAAVMPVDPAVRTRLAGLKGTTLHRLLGFNPGNRTRFRHNRAHPLGHDVVVVDETSMVSLSLMARLLEAVRPEARLVLVGDPEQLASVEAGAVLGDIVGPAARTLCLRAPERDRIALLSGRADLASDTDSGGPIGDGVVALRYVHRHRGAVAALARAVQHGDADAALAVLRESGTNVEWVDAEVDPSHGELLQAVRASAVQSGRAAIEAAQRGEAEQALAALGDFRLLCAHRAGPQGVATWTQQIERWLLAEVEAFSVGRDWYVGRPLIVTENDHALGLFNGDVGVVVAGRHQPMEAAFERGGEVVRVSPTRLAAVDTVYAMTVHKSQGSQFSQVAVLLPGPRSRLLTRELLYTALTRARERLWVVGSEASIRAAVSRPISRASGLRRALWGEIPPETVSPV
jgi:exodeoxyribonuclease V alpha subunit